MWEYINPFFGQGHAFKANWVFRSYRYGADSPQIRGRLGPVQR